MASSNAPRPWRPLGVLALVLVGSYGLVALLGDWSPRLGLDLRGGTSITLSATTTDGGDPTGDSMNQAVDIIRSRVNGSGVAEAEISTQGSSNIVVQVPGVGEDELIRLVGQTAELRFRPVRAVIDGSAPAPAPTPSDTATPGATETPTATPTDSASPSPAGRALTEGLTGLAAQTPTPTPTPSASPSPTPAPTPVQPPAGEGAPTPEEQTQLEAFDCANVQAGSLDDPNASLITCDEDRTSRFLLGPADLLGTDIDGATAGIPPGQVQWEVSLDLTGDGADKFLDSTTTLSSQTFPQNAFAIVLDGSVVSFPTVERPIPGGRASISGSFTQSEAQALATVLNYGSLPLTFEISDRSTVTPTLGQSQLDGGLLAGAIGLGLVLLYSLLYYRGLGFVVFASLAVAGTLTFAAVVLLGKAIGFTLTIAGIAGIIVAIGITADSFVVFFERVRDEIREGRSVRMAVETGWTRARRTVLASDTVALFAAFFLYVFSVANVRGFAFTLGLTTLVDLVVVFLFTKPLMSVLARSRFFGAGHRWSGLDPERLGAPRRTGLGRRTGAAAPKEATP